MGNRMMSWKVQVVIVLSCCIIGFDALPSSDYAQLWKPEFFPSVDQLLSRRSGRTFTISVEGNVGSGKSTVLNFFKQYPDISVYPEPVSTWTNLNGTNYLDLVYRNQTRWGMTFESLVMQTMLEIQLRDCRNYTTLQDLATTKPNTPPVKMMERSLLATRHIFVRNLNNTIAMEEFKVLEAWLYEDWLIHGNSTGITHHPRIIVIDANKDISVLQETYKYLAKAIFRSIPKQLRSNNFYNNHQQPESVH